MNEKSGYQQFQEDWEHEAGKESAMFDHLPVPELLERINSGRHGDYYTIWYSLARKASLAEAARPLFDVVSSQADYLIRYHAAAALILLGGEALSGWEPVMLSGEERYPVRENLAKVELILKAMLDERVR